MSIDTLDRTEYSGVTASPTGPALEGARPLSRFEPDHSAPRKYRAPSPKRAAAVAALALAAVGLAAFAHHWWTVGRFIQSTDDAYVGGDITVIAPKVAGFISEIAVADNQRVHAGDLLLKLDDRDYRAALAKADAAVALQQAALVNLDATGRLQEAVVAQARAAIVAADAEVARTRDDDVRYKNLAANGTESVQSFEKADADYKEAQADDERARAALTAAQRQLDVIATQKQKSRATLAAAVAERDLAKLNLSYTELRAPIDGVVGNRSAQVGAYATVGAQLISLVPVHGLWIDANFKEDQLARMHPGSPATVEVDLLGGRKFRGHVASIAPATGAQFSVLPPENATGNFTKIVQRIAVRILLDAPSGALEQLRPGLSVTAEVNTKA
ncbi:MAG TPA: HlyD family secretion protein [Verrucomicrobiae bacterium]|nr:HlyD family secretion protein [Verrucomicrobiae bacterium]